MLYNKNKVFWKNIFSYNLLRVKTQGQESLGMPAAWKLYLDVAMLWADMLIWKTCKRTLVIQLSRIIFKFGTRWESIYLQKKDLYHPSDDIISWVVFSVWLENMLLLFFLFFFNARVKKRILLRCFFLIYFFKADEHISLTGSPQLPATSWQMTKVCLIRGVISEFCVLFLGDFSSSTMWLCTVFSAI